MTAVASFVAVATAAAAASFASPLVFLFIRVVLGALRDVFHAETEAVQFWIDLEDLL